MQIPILSGNYTDSAAQFRTSYPRNMIPVPKQSGISEGFLRHTDGIIENGEYIGKDRGGINWNGHLYRVMGDDLVFIDTDGTITKIGHIGGFGYVTFDYSFDYLAVSTGGRMFLYDGKTLTQITDRDLSTVVDFVWIDGYFVTTDGEYLVVTELTDPFSVNPLKYGSSEASPDPIIGLNKLRNELVALNRYTIEFFDNVGGEYFPFQRVEGAQINKGCIGTHASCVVNDMICFMGGGFNEQISIYMGANGQFQKIASSEIDQRIGEYNDDQLSTVLCEYKIYNGHIHIMFHMPDYTMVYDMSASQIAQQKVWYTVDSGIDSPEMYRARNHVFCYGRWNVGDTKYKKIGYLDEFTSKHYGEKIGWEFSTQIIYNESRGANINSIELVATLGRYEEGAIPTISTDYSLDGVTWSQPKFIPAGKIGQYTKRLVWFLQGSMRNFRIQRFKGDSDAMISVARLEANMEALNA